MVFSIFQSVCVTVSIKAEALHNEIKHGDFFFILGAMNSLYESLRFKVFRKKFEGSEKNYKKINSSFELHFFPLKFQLIMSCSLYYTLCSTRQYYSRRIEAAMLAVPFTASCSFCYMSKPPATLEAKIYPTFTIPKPKSFERRNSIKLYLYGSASKKSNFELFLLQSTNGKELDDIFC